MCALRRAGPPPDLGHEISPSSRNRERIRTPKLPGFVMGLGLGGFVDGIVLHQVLQWHHMLTGTGRHPSDTLAGKEVNVLADGIFHVGTWLLVFAGTMLTLRAWQRRRLAPPWRAHFGLLLMGWGVFNAVEGLINHQILGLHHVRDDLGAPLSWDVAFLLSGVVLVAAGALLLRGTSNASTAAHA